MNNRFEIDSKCPDSDMVNKVKEEIKKQDNSLLEYGTWAYLVVKRCILAEDVVVGAGAKIGGEGPIAHVGTGLTVGAGATVKEGAKVFDSVKEGEEVC